MNVRRGFTSFLIGWKRRTTDETRRLHNRQADGLARPSCFESVPVYRNSFCMVHFREVGMTVFLNIYFMRRAKGYTIKNALRDAWRTTQGIY